MRRLAWLPLLLAGMVLGHSPTMRVTQAWSRATPPGAPVGVAYFTIENSGTEDTLLGITCALAARVEMHATSTVGGLMQMRKEDTLQIPANSSVRFEPGGRHAMLLGLKQPLTEGQPIALTLLFKNAGAVSIEATVVGLGAGPP